MAFLRNLLATLVGLTIFFFFGIIIFFGFIAALESQDAPTVKDNTVLYLKLSGVLQERTMDDPLQELFPAAGPRLHGLIDMLDAINAARDDDKIKGIYMEHQMLASGFAGLQEIRDALKEFKESGKFLYAYGEYVTEGDYYLASVADTFYLNPEGSLEFNGLSANITFWKGLFDKLEIEPEIFRVGEFKSAVEPFIRKDLSKENELQIGEFLTSIYDYYVKEVAESREMAVSDLKRISNGMEAYLPPDAERLGLVDKLAYEDEIKDLIASAVNEKKHNDINFMSYTRYGKTLKGDYSRDRVAVIVAEGQIVMGNSEDNSIITGERFAREIRKARENDRVKAIVLRVNSPGGSLTASDMIWRELALTKNKKPIIASMSNLAASGGYYIAMLADTIVAQPTTLTGSIGIFGMLFNFEKFLENKLGITHDVVKTGEYADIFTVTRPLNMQERQIIQRGVTRGYETFTTKVANARNMELESIRAIAGGRIWSGLQAKENGLVDILGSFEDAVKLAAEMADIADDYAVRYYPQQKPFIEQLMGRMTDMEVFQPAHNVVTPYLDEIQSLSRIQGIQALMPFDIQIN